MILSRLHKQEKYSNGFVINFGVRNYQCAKNSTTSADALEEFYLVHK